MPLVRGFSRGSPVSPRPCIPVLLHSHLISPSSALKTSLLRAAKISARSPAVPEPCNSSQPLSKSGVLEWSETDPVDDEGFLVSSKHRPLYRLQCSSEYINSLMTDGFCFSELACSPPTKASRVQFPAGSPDFRMWESCRTMPLVKLPFPPPPPFRRHSIPTSIILIGSQYLAVKSRPNLFSHSRAMTNLRRGSEHFARVYRQQQLCHHLAAYVVPETKGRVFHASRRALQSPPTDRCFRSSHSVFTEVFVLRWLALAFLLSRQVRARARERINRGIIENEFREVNGEKKKIGLTLGTIPGALVDGSRGFWSLFPPSPCTRFFDPVLRPGEKRAVDVCGIISDLCNADRSRRSKNHSRSHISRATLGLSARSVSVTIARQFLDVAPWFTDESQIVTIKCYQTFIGAVKRRKFSSRIWQPKKHNKLILALRGATVSERLFCSPPTKTIRVQSLAGSLRIFACGNRAGRYRWSVGFLGDLPFPPPFHSGAAPYSPQSPSSALKTSMLRAVQISSPLTLRVRLLASHLGKPGFDSPRVFACGNRAGRCRWSTGFSGLFHFPRPFIPVLKTSIRRTHWGSVFLNSHHAGMPGMAGCTKVSSFHLQMSPFFISLQFPERHASSRGRRYPLRSRRTDRELFITPLHPEMMHCAPRWRSPRYDPPCCEGKRRGLLLANSRSIPAVLELQPFPHHPPFLSHLAHPPWASAGLALPY
ncbi:hypothetical protein PR048_006243 [Dryococelus australis]|uniref:Uncharacterized protein n=1 Tax=Dryococelus australis TaxID=614101 RepID=A0ABQ9IAE4_9NEOP|nr:hypothetical protein PR048_006243 [Dryococelus australis]